MNIILIIILIILFLIIIYIVFRLKNNSSSIIATWTFQKPSQQCSINKLQNMNRILTPYIGKRPNNTILKMPILPNFSRYNNFVLLTPIPIPTSFSWREIGQDQIEKPRDQMNCGGCWAFAIVSALGDKYALKNQLKSPIPSATWLLSTCSITSNICANQQGCDGANVYNAVIWLEKNINKLDSCWPFDIISNSSSYGALQNFESPNYLGDLSNCCSTCCYNTENNISDILFSVKPNSIKYFGETIDKMEYYNQDIIDRIINDIKIEIMTSGPVTTSFIVLDNFQYYFENNAPNGSIYSNKDIIIDIDSCLVNLCPGYEGGHAVCLTGWGTQNGINYWEIRNSWGYSGDHGYCKVEMTNMNNIQYSVGFDIPIISDKSHNYFGGVISFTPNDLQPNNILQKSSFGNLLK